MVAMKQLVVLATILGALVTAQPVLGQPKDPPPSSAAPISFPTFGLELTPPVGWERQWEPTQNHLARWSPRGADPQKDFLEVLAMPRGSRSDREMAIELARPQAGKVFEGILDGRKAYRVWVEGQPHGTLYCTRGEVQYGIGYAHAGPNQAPLDAFCKAWKWSMPDSPAKHTQLDAEPLLIFDRFAMKLPSWVRPAKTDQPRAAQFVGVSYLGQKASNDFFIIVSIEEANRGKPLDAIAAADAGVIQKLNALPAPPAFKPLGEKNDRLVSDAVAHPTTTAKREITMTRNAIVALDANDRVTASLLVWTRDSTEQGAYLAMFEKIVESIEPVGDAKK